MAKWQYAIGYWNDSVWTANGADVAAASQIDFLNAMGADGWELAGVDPSRTWVPNGLTERSATICFYFKRTKPTRSPLRDPK